MASADMVRALTPARSIAASSTSAFMTVASMPMASAVGRDRPFSEIVRAAQNVAAADHDAEPDSELCAATRSAAKRSMVG